MPLTVPPEDAKFVETAAMAWMDCPKTVEVSNLGSSAVLARWLAVLRMRQVAEGKSRPQPEPIQGSEGPAGDGRGGT
jgi:hypothetical protein